MLNKENIDIYIKPFIGKYDTNVTSRNLTIKSWDVEKLEDDNLEIQLVFEKPLDVSVNFMYDTLVIQIKNETQVFKSVEGAMIDQFR